ncbi:hypothetical protein EG833_03960, partial [archaeon]|nr:hypothetical protein [archaeon]
MKKITVIIGILGLILFLSGCNAFEAISKDSSSEADLEDAQTALDDGDYQGAIDILEPGYDASNPDPASTRILASAYMGKAGIDLTNLVESSGDDDRDNFDVIASSLSFDVTGTATVEEATGKAASGNAEYITQSSVAEFLEYLETAQSYLTSLVQITNEDDDKVHLGMVSAVH